MLKNWLTGTSEEKIREMLKSYLKVDYDFMLEWCDRQAEENPECDCGCWGYSVEVGIIGTWKKNRYRGCPNVGKLLKNNCYIYRKINIKSHFYFLFKNIYSMIKIFSRRYLQ